MAGQQQEEIETIRSRTIEVKLSDADVKRISEKAAAHGFEAKLGGDTVALKTAKDLSGVVFGKSNGKYATMPESTDGHILIVGGAGSGKTAAVAIPTLMLMCGKVSQENYVELTAASAIPNKEIKSPQILRY